ncbi:unnamed protein product, partial [marine sediment metagenome]
ITLLIYNYGHRNIFETEGYNFFFKECLILNSAKNLPLMSKDEMGRQ